MKKIIRWEKWQSPFHTPDDEDDPIRAYRDAYERPAGRAYSGPCLSGPMGVLPLSEWAKPETNFQLVVGHANFNLTKAVCDRIESIRGVELFRIWTRYRFWVGVGRAFDVSQVKKAIEQAVLRVPSPPPRVQMAIEQLQTQLCGKHADWIVLVTPGQTLEVFTGAKAVSRAIELATREGWYFLSSNSNKGTICG